MKLLSALIPTRCLLFVVGWLVLAALGAPRAWGQAGSPPPTIRVSGTVSVAGSRDPVPGTTVQVRRTRSGVAANAQGDFLVTALATDTILFRAVGFKPYLLALGGTSLSQLVVQVSLVPDPVQLGEVKVTADRPDRASINRALRNMKRPAPPVVKIPKKAPPPKPLFPVDTTGPKVVAPSIATSNVDWLYEQFSREGKQRRKVEQLKAQEAAEKAQKARAEYNKSFKDNRGYE
ncbi:carboxypeptidase-like regulatory domain-containing protein [Hymenobacter sp. RP-2-7]|uniref:Carboxypeptidase-like regulatory domain-containing protein n=1 Tax=Hymenobacter polaris TaxID=2682546 RepID=A0A7Y0AIK1_9BACT|nr:carboxypeptidase-like regulatory domain-containing protein [Hymenobacter polaris]NML68029.1 carboxypeptidase-like regulatory domain-containing protein [Hymenobacter polaris]